MTLQPMRPDPDELLKNIQQRNVDAESGKPEIFLGYAAGGISNL